MFKLVKDTRTMTLMLTLNIFHTFFEWFFADLEHVFVYRENGKRNVLVNWDRRRGSLYRTLFAATSKLNLWCHHFEKVYWAVSLKYLSLFGWDHSFSTFPKFPEKLTFLTPWHVHVYLLIRAWKMLVFRENLWTY